MKCKEYNSFLKTLKTFFRESMKFGEDGVPTTKEIILLDSEHITQMAISRVDGTPVFGVEGDFCLSVNELYKVPQTGDLNTYMNPLENDDHSSVDFVWETSGFQFRNKAFPLKESDKRKRIEFPFTTFFTIPKGVLRTSLSPYLNIGESVVFTTTSEEEDYKVATFINDGIACAVSIIIADKVDGEKFQVILPTTHIKRLMKMSDGPFHVFCGKHIPMEFRWEDNGYQYSYAIAPRNVPDEE